MKKFFAIVLTISMLALAAMPVLAEEADTAPEQTQTQEAPQAPVGDDKAPEKPAGEAPSQGEAPDQGEAPSQNEAPAQAPAQNGQQPVQGDRGQRPMNGQRPMDNQNGQNRMDNMNGRGRQPEQNGQNSQGQCPMDGQNGQNRQPVNGQKPMHGGKGRMQGQRPMVGQNGQDAQQNAQNDSAAPAEGRQPMGGEGFVDFDALVQSGVITQETRDKIDAYMKENAPEAPADGEASEAPADGETPEAPAEGEATEAPTDGEAPEAPADGEQPDLLSDLLADGVITQAEYDAITAAQNTAV